MVQVWRRSRVDGVVFELIFNDVGFCHVVVVDARLHLLPGNHNDNSLHRTRNNKPRSASNCRVLPPSLLEPLHVCCERFMTIDVSVFL